MITSYKLMYPFCKLLMPHLSNNTLYTDYYRSTIDKRFQYEDLSILVDSLIHSFECSFDILLSKLDLFSCTNIIGKDMINRTRLSVNKFICTSLKPILRLNSKILYNSYRQSAITHRRECGDLGVLADSLIQLVEKSCDILNKPGLFNNVHIRNKEINRIRLSASVIILEWSNAITTLISRGVPNNTANLNMFKNLLITINLSLYIINSSCKLLMQHTSCSLRDQLLVASVVDCMEYFANLVNERITSKVKRYISILSTSVDDVSVVELFNRRNNIIDRMLC
ncbi:hypothetical protein [Ehrlichia ruminantium]|uniref:Uncharacterized protein n=2 Tax=Ehrlichia ruminantium TaxID=779 RepID=A0A0H3M1S8_EHRRW|nr:hypothetical protein [Ehrlichia ruminantium]QLK55402.1 hypothetical protein FDZ62_04050 [Ehrlichia ruminantium]QLK56318.1 hypothetical protein FDZ61_04045 [Ehrlichia ruminantium]UOD99517.1 hypothetical protein IMW62_04005 [Ehrlichia ruminantium]CAH58451.1 hypothetical protein Erum7190 [Ehrlichia ruminantium str. Welgevonden]CAI27251.1 Hypothetical protein ERWE_CDS_07570 [Ehrlichia ruminantium str. Welgevonden]